MDKEDNKQAKDKAKPGFFERLTGAKRESASEEAIRELVDGAEELADDEKRMINDIIALGDMAANEICTPRVDVMLVHDDETGRVALERMRGTGYSRLPVCHDDIDDIIGIVHYKDLIGPLMDGSIDEPVKGFMYEAMFVPETKDALPLLGEMQAAHQHRRHRGGDRWRDSGRVRYARRDDRASGSGHLACGRTVFRRGRPRARLAS